MSSMVKNDVILELKNVKTHFHLDEGILKAVDGVDLKLRRGKILGIVGESGCGKSVTSQAILGIVPPPGKVTGEIILNKRNEKQKIESIDVAKLNPFSNEIRAIRGGDIAMIFQEPMKAFSPIHTVGNQIIEALLLHITDNPKSARELAIQALSKVGIPNPEKRIDEYPHQLSGGMRQRAMIAMALSCNPSILIADEPTTALDVTMQVQVLQLIVDLKNEFNSSIIYITHDLGVIAELADDVAVMYLGKIVEYADVDTLFHGAMHPYTKALMSSIPTVSKTKETNLTMIKGSVPYPMNLPSGCGFYSRCEQVKAGLCNQYADIALNELKPGHFVRCPVAESEYFGEA